MIEFNLRFKVAIFTITIIIILLSISHIITSTLVSQNLAARLDERGEIARENLNIWLSDRKEDLHQVAENMARQEWLSGSMLQDNPLDMLYYLREYYPSDQNISSLLIESSTSAWEVEITPTPQDPQTRLPRHTAALDETMLAFGVSEIVVLGNELLVIVGVPVRSNLSREQIGMITVGNAIDSQNLMNLQAISEADQIHVVVNDALFLSTSPENERETFGRALAGKVRERDPFTVNVDDKQFLTFVQPINTVTGDVIGYFVLQMDNVRNRELLTNISLALNMSALGAFIVFSLISVFFTNRITTKLNQLVGHATALAEGRYEEPVRITSTDEVGVLAKSFEDLRIKIRQRTQDLLDTNVDLDQRVREIASLNNVMVAIASNLPMERVFSLIAREAGKHIPVDFAYLALKEESGEKAMRLVSRFPDLPLVEEFPHLGSGKSLAGKAAGGQTLTLANLDPESDYVDESWMARSGLVSAYILPLLSEKKTIGSLCLAAKTNISAEEEEFHLPFLERLVTEITIALQRLRLNEELQLIESRLSRLFSSVRDGIFQTDKNGRIVFLNTAARMLFGIQAEHQLEEYTFQFLINDKKERRKLLDLLDQRGYVTNYPVVLTRSDNSTFHAELSVNFTEGEVGERGIEGIVRDVTPRKKLEQDLRNSEAFLRQVIEGTNNAIFTLNSNGEITFMNPQLAEITGFEENELRNRSLTAILGEQGKSGFGLDIESVILDGKTTGGVELTLQRKDGSTKIIVLSLAPLLNQGSDRAAVGALSDITEIKKLEEQLTRSERLASMGQIAAGIAHEINNPLGIILGFTQDLISDKDENDPDVEPLRVIERETQRCARIVKDLLDMARASDTTRKAVDLKSLIEKTLPLFKLHFRDSGIDVKTRLDDVPLIFGDPQQLQQVIMNVIFNSVHAMENGGGRLTVNLRQVSSAGNRVVKLVIKDSGAGIAEDDLNRVFDPFFSTKRGGGVGLGLFIVHRLIEGHGGTITIESKLDKGTECVITLPIEEMTH